MAKLAKWLGIGAAVTVALIVLVLGGAVLYLRTESGRDWAVAKGVELLSEETGLAVRVKGSSGDLFDDFSLEGITVRDEDGVIFKIAALRLAWRPSALFRRALAVDQLDVNGLDIRKIPAGAAPAEQENFVQAVQAALGDAGLPLDVSVARLRLDKATFGKAVLGEPVALSATGRLRADRTLVPLDIELRMRRTDGVAADGHLLAQIDQNSNILRLDLSYREAAGGVVPSLLALAKTVPIRLAIKGKGTLQGWRGTIEAEAGKQSLLTGRISLALTDVLRFSTDGTVVPTVLSPSAQWLGPQATFKVAGHLRPGGTIKIDTLSTTADAVRLTGQGELSFERDRVSATVQIALPDLGRLETVTGQRLSGAAAVKATLSGRLSAPEAKTKIAGTNLSGAEFSVRALDADLMVRPTSRSAGLPDRFAFTAKVRATWLAYPGGALAVDGNDLTSADLSGSFVASAERLTLDRVVLATPAGQVSGRAEVIGFEKPKVTAKLSARDVAIPGDGAKISRQLRVDADLAVDLARETGQAKVTGTASNLDIGFPALEPLLAGQLSVNVDARMRDGVITIRKAEIKAPKIKAMAKGEAKIDGKDARLTARLEVPDLSVLSRLAGQGLAGAVVSDISLRGSSDRVSAEVRFDATALKADQLSFRQVKGRVSVADLLAPPAGTVDITVTRSDLSGTLRTRFALRGQRLHLDDLVANAAGARAKADLVVNLDRSTVVGKADATIPNLAPLGRIAGLDLSGAATMKAQIGGSKAGAMSVVLDASGLTLRDPAGPDLSVATVKVNLAVTGSGPNDTIDATVTAEQLRRRAVRLDRLAATLKGPVRSAAYSFKLKGAGRDVPMSLTSAGEIIDPMNQPILRIARLTGKFDGTVVKLTKPARLKLRPQLELETVNLKVGSGTARIRYAERGRTLSLQADASKLPADLLRFAGLAGSLRGTLAAKVALEGDRRRPKGAFSAAAKSVSLARGTGPSRMDASLNGRLNGGRATLTARVTTTNNRILTINADVPISGDPRAKLKASIKGEAGLRVLTQVGSVRGVITANLAIAGTPDKPVVSGSARLAEGRIEVQDTGAVLSNLVVDLKTDGQTVRIQGEGMTDGRRGKIALNGQLGLRPGGRLPIDLALTSDRARLLRLTQATATVTSQLTVKGDLSKGVEIAGKATVVAAEFQIPRRSRARIYKINVVEINGPKTGKAAKPNAAKTVRVTPPIAVRLNVDVSIPGRAFVRGQGIETEWRGDLRVRGQLPTPKVEGQLTTVRGGVDVIGKKFELTRGIVSFDGGDATNPTLDIVAAREANDITAEIAVSGTANRPKIEIRSQPALPQEQVLSRVLFGRDAGALSTAQAVQLGAAAAAFAAPGDGPGVLGFIRRTVGVDLVEVTGGESDDVSDTRLKVGKYLTDDVLIKAEQGVRAKDSKVGVEVKLDKNFVVESDVGSDTQGKVGVKWKFDY